MRRASPNIRRSTLIALHRTIDGDGQVREQFRTLHPADAREAAAMPCSAGAFAIVEDAAPGPTAMIADETMSVDEAGAVDLLDLAGTAGPSARERGDRGS